MARADAAAGIVAQAIAAGAKAAAVYLTAEQGDDLVLAAIGDGAGLRAVSPEPRPLALRLLELDVDRQSLWHVPVGVISPLFPPGDDQTGAAAIVPLSTGYETLGYVLLRFERADDPAAETDRDALEAVVRMGTETLVQAREQDRQRRARAEAQAKLVRSRALAALARTALAETETPETALTSAVRGLAMRLDESCALWLSADADEQGDGPLRANAPAVRLAASATVDGLALDAAGALPWIAPGPLEGTATSAPLPGQIAIFPVEAEGQRLGVLAVGRARQRRPFAADELDSLQEFADRIGSFLRAARTRSRERELRAQVDAAAARMGAIHAATNALSSVANQADLADVVATRLARTLEVGRVYLVTRSGSEDDGRFGLVVGSGATLGPVPASRQWEATDRFPGAEVARAREAVFLATRGELLAWPGGIEETAPDGPETNAAALLPLCLGARCLGILGLEWPRARTFDVHERSFLNTVAHALCDAVERVRLREEERRTRERAALLTDVGELLGAGLDGEAVLKHFAHLAVPRLGDVCTVEVAGTDGRLRQVALAHVEPDDGAMARETRLRYPTGRDVSSPVLEAVRSGKPVHVDRPGDDLLTSLAGDADQLRLLRALGLQAVLIVPLLADRPVGALTLGRRAAGPIEKQDLALITELARRVAFSVENARLSREARRASDARDDFLAVAGHELRNPLAALLLQAQSLERIARREGSDARFTERLHKVAGAVRRLQRLIEGLLDASRITSGRLRLEPQGVNLSALVEQVAHRFTDAARVAESELLVRAEPDVTGVWDPARLEQVVSNLIENALKYGRGRPIQIRVSRRGAVALVSVADEGTGAAAAEQKTTFERLTEPHAPRDLGGFGLPLWIARQIADACGGHVTLDSVPHRGSTFTVSLPLTAGMVRPAETSRGTEAGAPL